jgi:hypothetical protein
MALAWPAVQVAGAHTAPAVYLRQPPAPLQVPSFPQLATPWSRHAPVGSVPPAGTAAQVPGLPGSAHDWQLPVQAVPQQTPCSQWPLVHSSSLAQSWPVGRFPHDPF